MQPTGRRGLGRRAGATLPVAQTVEA